MSRHEVPASKDSNSDRAQTPRRPRAALARAARMYLAGKSERERKQLFGHRARGVAGRQGQRAHAPRFWQKWQDALLGRMPDAEAARKTGRSAIAVRKRRLILGIPCLRALPQNSRRWTEEEIQLLGTMTDSELARRLGCKKQMVLGKRWRLKIPVFPARKPSRAWKAAELKLLGRFKDSEVGRQLDCPQYTVRFKRLKLGIRAWRPIPSQRPWTPAELKLLGTLPDEGLARRLKRTPTAVLIKRTRCGIPNPAPRRSPPRVWKAWELKLLGRFPDSAVGRRVGCPQYQVRAKRRRLGIRAWRSLPKHRRLITAEDRRPGARPDQQRAKRPGPAVNLRRKSRG